MTIGRVRVTVSFIREIDTEDFLEDEDSGDLEEGEEPEIGLATAVERLKTQYEDGSMLVQDEAEFETTPVEVEPLGG